MVVQYTITTAGQHGSGMGLSACQLRNPGGPHACLLQNVHHQLGPTESVAVIARRRSNMFLDGWSGSVEVMDMP